MTSVRPGVERHDFAKGRAMDDRTSESGENAALVKMRPGHPWAGNSGRIVPDPTAPDGAVKVQLDNGMSCYAWPGHYRRVTVVGRSSDG